MDSNRIYNMLGLAQKAGRITAGENLVLDKLDHGGFSLILIAENISNPSLKLVLDRLHGKMIPCWQFGSKEDLGRAVGKSPRTVLGINDKGLAGALLEMLRMNDKACEIIHKPDKNNNINI